MYEAPMNNIVVSETDEGTRLLHVTTVATIGDVLRHIHQQALSQLHAGAAFIGDESIVSFAEEVVGNDSWHIVSIKRTQGIHCEVSYFDGANRNPMNIETHTVTDPFPTNWFMPVETP